MVIRLKNICILLMVLLSLPSCRRKEAKGDDPFTISKSAFQGSQLRTDGFYYYRAPGESNYAVLFFYRNGVILDPLAIENLDETVKFVNSIEDLPNRRKLWGLFKIDGNSIKTELNTPKSTGTMLVMASEGNIINDTTFVLKKIYRSKDGSQLQEIDRTYTFRKLTQKPDSTNSFF